MCIFSVRISCSSTRKPGHTESDAVRQMENEQHAPPAFFCKSSLLKEGACLCQALCIVQGRELSPNVLLNWVFQFLALFNWHLHTVSTSKPPLSFPHGKICQLHAICQRLTGPSERRSGRTDIQSCSCFGEAMYPRGRGDIVSVSLLAAY
jgi:hypothetical protein